MGCDIHSFAEVKTNGKWIRVEDEIFRFSSTKKTSEPFHWRSYSMFGFLANVRNYSESPVIAEPRGLPDDSEWLNSPGPYGETNKQDAMWDTHHHSYIILKELLDYDYDQLMEDRRYTEQIGPNMFNGGATCEPGHGRKMTVHEFLGDRFFEDIIVLQTLGEPEDVRIVFWFDS